MTRIQMSHDHLCKCFILPVIVVVLQPSEVVVRLSVMTGRLGLAAEQKELEDTGETLFQYTYYPTGNNCDRT